MNDAEQREKPEDRGEGGRDGEELLDAGLRAAFGQSGKRPADTHGYRSVTQLIAEKTGSVHRVRLRDIEDEPNPVVNPLGSRGARPAQRGGRSIVARLQPGRDADAQG